MSAGQPVGLPELPATCSCGRLHYSPDIDCQTHGQCASFAHPCRCGVVGDVFAIQRDAYEAGKRDAVAALTADPGKRAALAFDCGGLDIVAEACDEVIDKSEGTKRRIIDQIMRQDDCDKCPPGFLAVTTDLIKAATALRILAATLTDTPKEQQA